MKSADETSSDRPTSEASGRSPRDRPVFVTGASGYIGGRLVPALLEAGYRVRCLARSPRKLEPRPWAGDEGVEIVKGDVGEASLAEVMAGCGAAYYLVHSMLAAGSDYAERDRELARNFAAAAASAGVDRILYLGGLGETGEELSEHLDSRREVEFALADGPVPVTVLRAAMIIGSGSASFEILRYLVERLPVMITPRWVSTPCQPIGVRNVLEYLVRALETPATVGRTLDIGGTEVMSYLDILHTTAECLGLPRRRVLPVPVLTPRLSSLWIHLVTPLSRHIAQPLADGLRNPVVCRNDEAARLMPQDLLSVREAVLAAVEKTRSGQVQTSWRDAGPIPGDPDWAGGTTFTEPRVAEVAASPANTFRAVRRIGGTNGWYAANFLWKLRGAIDRLVGGPGLGRGRRNAETIEFGDALDFWRVIGFEDDRRLELGAEMKLPGVATLEFSVEPHDAGTLLRQTARFQPQGLLGILYWWSIWPFHGIVFNGMLNGVQRKAEELQAAEDAAGDGATASG